MAKLAYHIALGGVVALIVGFILLNIGLLGTLPFFLFVGSIFIYLLGILASIVGGFMGISASSRLKKEGSDKKGKRFKMARRAIWLGLTSIIAIIYYLAISLKS
ncbi:MAG: hypothetical protein MRZ79_19420 [Bacteroidia bacterium]|nr:hypothetical protein [Bacteroidia bacterium]